MDFPLTDSMSLLISASSALTFPFPKTFLMSAASRLEVRGTDILLAGEGEESVGSQIFHGQKIIN